MKQPVTITAAHMNIAYTTDRPQGIAELYLEIGERWVKVISDNFDPSGFHISHIVEGHGIVDRAKNDGKPTGVAA